MAKIPAPPIELWAFYYPNDPLPDNWLPLTLGLIHHTWKFTTSGTNSAPMTGIFQQINTHIFPRLDILYSNYAQLLIEAENCPFIIAHWFLTSDGQPWAVDNNGGIWRHFSFIEGVPGTDQATVEQIVAHASALGRLHFFLAGLETHKFEAAIPEFLNLGKRMQAFEYAISSANPERKLKSNGLLGAIKEIQIDIEPLLQQLESGQFPLRLIHGDPKSTNLIFHLHKPDVRAFLDWDTLMPGTILYDYGDLIRSIIAQTGNADAILLNHIEKAYTAQVESILSHEEKNELVNAPLVIMWVQAIRFLTDYLTDDPYYKTQYPDHNLDRAILQWEQLLMYKNR